MMSTPRTPEDPILVSVLRNRLFTICEEMGLAMLRTARSPWLNACRDFSTALFDADGRLLSQADFVPILVGTSRFALRATVKRFGDNVEPGDVVLVNDPYFGGSHLTDLTILYPIFLDGQLAYWVVNKAHYADIGGCVAGGANPHAVEVYQEGLRIPPVKLYRRGVLNEDLRDFLLLNVRDPDTFWADLAAHVTCARMAEGKIKATAERYGAATLAQCQAEILDSAEKEIRQEIRRMPAGTYRGRALIEVETAGRPAEVNIDVAVTIDGETITVDYSGTHAEVPSFVNSPIANTCAATYVAIFSILNPDTVRNDGSYRRINVIAPEGSLLNPAGAAPVALCTLTTGEVLIEACWRALSQAVPTRTPCGWARTCTATTFGYAPDSRRWYTMSHFLTHGGAGAVGCHDGWNYLSPVVASGALTKPNVEAVETRYPYRVLVHEFAEDSCGAGRYRGGLGTLYRVTPLDHDAEGVMRGDGMRISPFGLAGGRSGVLQIARIFRKDGSIVELAAKSPFRLNEGDVLETRTSGGGGWGDPRERPRELVRQDVADGLISVEHAYADYGLRIAPGQTDEAAARTAP